MLRYGALPENTPIRGPGKARAGLHRVLHGSVSKETKKIEYFTLLESILRYGIELWGAASLTNLEKTKSHKFER